MTSIIDAAGGPDLVAVLHNLGRANTAIGDTTTAQDALRRSRIVSTEQENSGGSPAVRPAAGNADAAWFLRLDKDVAPAEFELA